MSTHNSDHSRTANATDYHTFGLSSIVKNKGNS